MFSPIISHFLISPWHLLLGGPELILTRTSWKRDEVVHQRKGCQVFKRKLLAHSRLHLWVSAQCESLWGQDTEQVLRCRASRLPAALRSPPGEDWYAKDQWNLKGHGRHSRSRSVGEFIKRSQPGRTSRVPTCVLLRPRQTAALQLFV